MKATIVLPAYNEEKNIAEVIKSVKSAGDYEIIVVDDGSKDRTAPIARKLGVVCVSLGKNRGKGYACVTGAKLASNENIVFIDADNQHDASEIPMLLKELNEYDMVLGKRDFSNVPLQRRVSNAFARKIVSAAAGVKFNDALCGFRAIKKKKFFELGIQKHRYEFESEMLIKAAKMKMKIKEIPVKVRYGIGSSMSMVESAKVTAYILGELIKR
jgi:glycosyltransferase involved in cell wall biosynthesis